jgi:hypothetical protein
MTTGDVGGPDAADGVARIVLSRERGAWRDLVRSYGVVIDGEQVAKIKRGERIELPVTPGRHEIFMRIDWCTSPTMHLDVRPGDYIQLWCAPGGSATAGLAQVVVGSRSYIRLGRI